MCRQHTLVLFTHAISICIFIKQQNERWAVYSHITIAVYLVQLHKAPGRPLDPLPTACRKATPALFCQKSTLVTVYNAQWHASMAMGRDVTLVFPEVILVRGQHHGLQQLLAKSPNSAHRLLARGKASTRCSTLQSLSNSDFLSSLFFSLEISRKRFFC